MLQFEVWETELENGTEVYVKVKQTLANVTMDVAIANCTLECPVEEFVERGELYSASHEDLETLCADANYLLKLLTESEY